VILILDPDVEQDFVQLVEHPVSQVDIESTLTAMAIRVRPDLPPPLVSASASNSNSAVSAANCKSGATTVVALQGFSRITNM
jgi:hypothetical protein